MRTGAGGQGPGARATIALLAGLLLTSAGVRAETINRIVAMVDQDIFTTADVRQRMHQLIREHQIENPTPVEAVELERVALRSLIEQRLMLHEAKALELTVDAAELRERMDAFVARFESRAAYETWLETQGLTDAKLRDMMREQLLVQDVIDRKVRTKFLVSPREVSEHVQAHPELAKVGDRVRVSHILIRVSPERPADKARQRIEQIAEELQHGGSFPDLAKKYSEDPQGPEGGDLGWVAKGEMLPALDAVIFQLNEGTLSAPVQSPLGFHLLRVEERQSSAELSVQEAHQAVFRQLYQQKYRAALDAWLTELKHRAYIEIFPETS